MASAPFSLEWEKGVLNEKCFPALTPHAETPLCPPRSVAYAETSMMRKRMN